MIVYNQAAWTAYIEKVRAQDLRDQQAGIEGRQSGAVIAPPDKSPWITPFPYVAGYDLQNEKPRFADKPLPGGTPEANDIKVLQGARAIARLRNFDVTPRGFGYSPIHSCTSRFPEVYRIPRTKVLA